MTDELGVNYLVVLRRSARLIFAVTLIGLAAALAIAFSVAKTYSATAQLYVSVPSASNNATDLQQGSNYVQQQMQSYASVVTTESVLRPAALKLGLASYREFGSRISAATATGSVLLSISAQGRTPEGAATAANAVARSFQAVAPTLGTVQSNGSPVKVTVVQPAVVPASPSAPDKKLDVALGAFLGLALGILLAIARSLFDTRLRDSDDLQEVTNDLPILAAIPMSKAAPTTPIVFDNESTDLARAEAYRLLRTGLNFARVSAPRPSVVVVSAVPSEGKTLTAVNLAVAIAESGVSAILVDADLRRPAVAKYMGMDNAVGLTDVLIGAATLEEAIQIRAGAQGPLHVLPSGPTPPNPSELIGSAAFEALFADLEDRYDLVIVDSPPVTMVSDASLLAAKAGGVLLLVGAGRARKPDVRQTLEQLENARANLLGLVLNRIQGRRGQGDYGGYYYSYGSTPGTPPPTREETAPTASSNAD